jgi:hypothetical protein
VTSPYSISFACTHCRKAFKRTGAESVEQLTCPNCGSPSWNVGRHFKAPASDDHGQWKKVALLCEHGLRFQRLYDEHGRPIPYPKTLREAEAFIKQYGKSGPK